MSIVKKCSNKSIQRTLKTLRKIRNLLLPILILLLTACSNVSAETSDYKQELGYATAIEFKKLGKVIPEKLEAIGFTEHTLISYYYLDTVEYFVFSDWRTKESGGVVTWVVVNGEVKNYFKDEEGKEEGRKI